MTAQEYLLRPADLAAQIRRKEDRIRTLRRLASRLSPRLQEVRVQTSPDPGILASFLADAADEEREIALLQDQWQQATLDSARAISRLPDERMARILELRYLDSLSWREIADELGYCLSRTYKLYQQALDLLPLPPEVQENPDSF